MLSSLGFLVNKENSGPPSHNNEKGLQVVKTSGTLGKRKDSALLWWPSVMKAHFLWL